MNTRPLLSAVLVGCVALLSSGCAIFTKGRTQEIVVRSMPSGARVTVDQTDLGVTPIKVKLSRSIAHRIDISKTGFGTAATILLPTPNEYEQRFLRWGLDYDLGAMTDLRPGEVEVGLLPATPGAVEGDLFAQMSYRVLQADALLSSGEISRRDHSYLVGEIVNFYTR